MSTVHLFRKATLLAGLAAFALLFAACVTQITIAEVPEGLSPAQLFQRAQDALNKDEYDNARVFIAAFKARYPDERVKDLEADYLLAQVLVKENKNAEALAAFKALSARYKEAEAGNYPQWVKILADKLVMKLEAKVQAANPGASPVPAATPAPATASPPVEGPSPAPAATEAPQATPAPAASTEPQATVAPAASTEPASGTEPAASPAN